MALRDDVQVRLGLDDRQFKSGLARARADLSGLAQTAKSFGGAFSVLLPAAGIAGLGKMVKDSIDLADNLRDLKQQTGLAIGTLTGLSFAAESSGTDLQGVAKGVGQFARFMDAAKEPTSEQGKLLAQLGLKARDPERALSEIADIFARMPDGLEKTNLSMELFGKAGTSMIPMLNGGGQALEEMIRKGKDMTPFTDEFVEAADRINDRLLELRRRTDGLGLRLAGEMVPGLDQITLAMTAAADEAGPLMALLVGFGGFAALALGIDDSLKSLNRLKRELEDLQEKLKGNENTPDFLIGDLREREASLKKQIADIEASVKATIEADKAKKKAEDQRERDNRVYENALSEIRRDGLEDMRRSVDAQKKILSDANSALKKLEDARLDQAEKNRQRLADILAPEVEALDLNADDEIERINNRIEARANLLQTIADARNALSNQDFQAAIKAGESAAEQILALKAAGADSISVLASQQREVASIQDQAYAAGGDAAKQGVTTAQAKLEAMTEQVKFLEAIPLGFDLDAAAKALLEARARFQDFLDKNPITVRANVTGSGLGVPGFAAGGYVSGPGGPRTDSILARLSDGEFVLNAAATRFYGASLLDRLNRLSIPRFADGGIVSASSGTPINLYLPGGSGPFEVRAEESVANALQRTVGRASLMHGRRR